MGKKSMDTDGVDDISLASLATSIISTIQSSDNGKSMELKALRSTVLPTVDKQSKKVFKAAIKLLEQDEKVSLNCDGIVKLSKSERSKSKSKKKSNDDDPKSSEKKKSKKKDKKRKRESKENAVDEEDVSGDIKKRKKHTTDQDDIDEEQVGTATQEEEEDTQNNNEEDTNGNIDPKDKNKPCKNNPQGITRLFLGNLPFSISEPTLNTHLKNVITHIKWITDKETGKFYGSAFCEVKTSKDAAMCMKEMNGKELMGRPLKINYAPVREGEEGDWPPRSKVITGGKVANASGQAGGSGIKAMSVKPEGCSKLFIGNLSYDIDDEGITKFFMGVEAEVKSVRWLHHRDSGDFKGCGFVDFWNTEACEKAATLNGKTLLGRPIRIDWTE